MSEVRNGIDLGGTKIEGIALASDGRTLLRQRVPTPRDDYDATVQAIVDLVNSIEHELGNQGTVGIGTPGAVSPATGRIKNSNSTWVNGCALLEDLTSRLNRPVRLDNDANCFALSEALDGGGEGARVVFGVILGTGTGGGVIVDGRPLVGVNAIGGEWGHNPLPGPRQRRSPDHPVTAVNEVASKPSCLVLGSAGTTRLIPERGGRHQTSRKLRVKTNRPLRRPSKDTRTGLPVV